MKRYIVILICLFFCLFSRVLAQEDTVRIEGEDYIQINYEGSTINRFAEFSKSKALVTSVSALTENCTICYKVTVEEDGTYEMSGVTTAASRNYSSDFYISINDGEPFLPLVTLNKTFNWSILGRNDYMGLQNFGLVKLKSGENEVKIIFDEDDIVNYKYYFSIIDYFEFRKTEPDFKIQRIRAVSDAANVFLKKDNIRFKIEFTKKTEKPMFLRFKIKNIYEELIKNGKVMIPAGIDVYTLDVGTMFSGWYSLEINDFDMDVSVAHPQFFSVIEKTENRVSDSPFGVDFNRGELESHKELIKAISYTGIGYARVLTDVYQGYETPEYMESYFNRFRQVEKQNGIKSLQVYDNWASTRTSPEDLFEAYNAHKHLAEQNVGRGSAYEIWNEQESSFYDQTADVYASYFKAAAIGISDGDSEALKMTGGFGSTSENFFVRQLMRNDIFNYADIYAYHSHSQVGTGRKNIMLDEGVSRKHIDTARSYDPKKMIWLTEAGCNMNTDNTQIPDKQTLLSQAKYYITSTAKALSFGVDKRFWFRTQHFMEGVTEWGTFSPNNQPYPAYNAIATTTKILGDGIYKGELTNMCGGLEGYMFSNGTNDIAVVWADEDTKYQIYSENIVSVTDFLGKTKEYLPCNCISGVINIPVSYMPVFIEFEGCSDKRNYYSESEFEHKKDAEVYNEADRIVIQQLWEGQDMYASKDKGYELNKDVAQRVIINVYNFSGTVQSGVLNFETGSPVYDIAIAEVDLNIAEYCIDPMSKQILEIYVNLKDNAQMGDKGFLRISGETSTGDVLSQSVSAFYSNSGARTVTVSECIEDWNNVDKWSVNNHYPNTNISVSNTKEQTLEFNVTSQYDHAYYWPSFAIESPVEDKQGICFYIRSTDGKEHNINVYAYCSDASYWLGSQNSISYGGEWKQIIIPWYLLKTFRTNQYEGDFDPEKIQSIAIGSYALTGKTSYEIKDISFYSSDSAADLSDAGENILFMNIKDGQIYDRETDFNIRIKVGACEKEQIRIYLGNREITDYTLDNGIITINSKINEPGIYILQVIRNDGWGYNKTASVKIYIRE